MASKRAADEIIVVDDASTDSCAALARGFGAQVLALPDGPHGPAVARNRGAAAAHGDVLVFIDADVAVHRDTLAMMEKHLSEHPEIAALFGSYDDAPPARGWVTLYKNLLHHYVHQHSKREASTFWAGSGAIRRDIFLQLGGFESGYANPSAEDIELGVRLRRAGHRVWLCTDVQGTHLKCWTFSTLLRSDIFDRAVPWTRLILSNAELPSDLNLDSKSRFSAIAVWASVLFFALGFWIHWSLIGTVLCIFVLALLNIDLYRFFARRGGITFAVGAFGLHALYFLYSSLVFGVMLGVHLIRNAVGSKNAARKGKTVLKETNYVR
jgi:glycosyltransferase involved in cell wall biosynthesis